MRKKKYFKAVYSAHIDFKDKEDLNRQLMLDVDDWIFNTMGTSLGIELQRLIVRAETHKQKRRNTHESRYCS